MSQHVLSRFPKATSTACLSCQWRLQIRSFQTTSSHYAGGPRTQQKFSKGKPSNAQDKRQRPGSRKSGDRTDVVPSRMRLSGSVARSRPVVDSNTQKRSKPQPTIERYSGMNRRQFTPDLASMKKHERLDHSKRMQAQKDESKPKRPPTRTFKQMKQIASLESGVSVRQRLEKAAIMQVNQDFETFGLLPEVMEALIKDTLRGLEHLEPTPVQRLAIPPLMKKYIPSTTTSPEKPEFSQYLIAAETGSGKTLAYLLPLLDSIKRAEKQEKVEATERSVEDAIKQRERNERHAFDIDPPEIAIRDPNAGRPRALILLPTSELVAQVGGILKSLSHVIKFRSEEIHRDVKPGIIRSRVFGRPIEVLVSTPYLLESLLKEDPQLLSKTTQIVVDEADSLFDRSFSPITNFIITQATQLQKLILCSATIPKSLDTYLNKKYPRIERLVTPNLHAVPRRVQLSVVEVDKDPYRGNKELACADILNNIAKDGTEPGFIKRVVVFVNERELTTTLAKYLNENGFKAIDVSRDTGTRSALAKFIGPPEPLASNAGGSSNASSQKTGNNNSSDSNGRNGSRSSNINNDYDDNNEYDNNEDDKYNNQPDRHVSSRPTTARARDGLLILVTTDITSRGIDTRTVKNVLLYDVPFSSIDFIHRLGRTGRMGRRGKAFVLVDKTSNKSWVKEIKTSMFMGKSLV